MKALELGLVGKRIRVHFVLSNSTAGDLIEERVGEFVMILSKMMIMEDRGQRIMIPIKRLIVIDEVLG